MPISSAIDLLAPALPSAPEQSLGPKSSPKDAAKAFDGLFASMMVKQMRQTLGSDGLFGHDPGDVLGGLFDHFMGQHMAEHGGLGIGAVIEKYLDRSQKT
jgi:flagellar protein FlgJ